MWLYSKDLLSEESPVGVTEHTYKKLMPRGDLSRTAGSALICSLHAVGCSHLCSIISLLKRHLN